MSTRAELAIQICGRMAEDVDGRAHWNCPFCDNEICDENTDHDDDCAFAMYVELIAKE